MRKHNLSWGVVILAILAYIIYGWGDVGYTINLLGFDVPAYPLYWFWLCLLAVVHFTGDIIDGRSRHTVFFTISLWWIANTQAINLLQNWWFRGIGESGGTVTIFSEQVSVLVTDYIMLAPIDLGALIAVWILAKMGRMRVSGWLLLFCFYLVGNLFGHAAGAYALWNGTSPDIVSNAYDSYMYLIFTVMLILQALGAGGDALLRWSGSSVDLYADIRPFIRGFASRNLRLF